MLALLSALLVVLAPAPLRLAELVAQVGDDSPAVGVAEADVEVRRAAVGVAGSWDDPTFTVMSEAIPLGRMSEDADPTMITYRVGQTLNLLGRRDLSKRVAHADVARGEAGARRARWDARAQAVRFFDELWMVDEAELPADQPLPELDVAAAAASGTPEVTAAQAVKEGASAQRALARKMYWPMLMIEAEIRP